MIMNSILTNYPPCYTTTARRRESLGRRRLALVASGLALLCTALFSGCRSMSMPASASFASVVIAAHTAQEIQQAAVAVFQGEGFRASQAGGGTMVFER